MLWFQSGLKCWTDGHTYPYCHVAKNHKKIQYIQAIYMEAERCQHVMPSWHPTQPWPPVKASLWRITLQRKVYTERGLLYDLLRTDLYEQTQWNRAALSLPPIPACEYDVFIAKLPSVIRARLSILRNAEGVQMKRNLIACMGFTA